MIKNKLIESFQKGWAEVKAHTSKTLHVAKDQFLNHDPAMSEEKATAPLHNKDIFETQVHTNNNLLAEVRPASFFGLRVILIVIFLFVVWGGLAPLKIYVVGPGSIVLSEKRKVVQHYEGGIIKQILVRDGDFVKENQVLLVLQDTQAKAQVDLVRAQLLTNEALEARLIAEKDDKAEVTFPEALLRSTEPEVVKAVENQKQQFALRYTSLHEQISMMQQQILQLEEGLGGIDSQLKAIENQIVLNQEDLTTTEKLFAKGLALKPRLLELKNRAEALEGQKGEYIGRVASIKQQIGELKIKILNIQTHFSEEVNKELEQVQLRVSESRERLQSVEDVLTRTVIRAPTAGIISNLQYHTIGGVIPQSHTILEVIPQDDTLIVEGMIQPKDIEGLHAGQDAMVNLSAFKSRLVPRVKGKVIYVAPDITQSQDPRMGGSYYVVRVEVTQKELARLNYKAKLYPGMPAETFIVIGEHTMLHYLFSPILDSLHRAFIEK